MSETPETSPGRADAVAEPILIHGLLVCRNAELGPEGRLDLEEVLEVLAVDQLPGDVGPLTFVAFVRNLPVGPNHCAFVIHHAGQDDVEVARMPLDVDLPEAYAARQVALQMRMPTIEVKQGGWFDIAFEHEGRRLAVNRFAIGQKGA